MREVIYNFTFILSTVVFRLSIRNRFLIIGFLVIVAVVVEGIVIADAQAKINQIDDKGKEYLFLDEELIRLGSGFLTSAEQMTKMQIQQYFATYIPHEDTRSYDAPTFDDLEKLKQEFDKNFFPFRTKILDRANPAERNYQFGDISLTKIFGLNIFDPVDRDLIARAETIIDQENGSVQLVFNELQPLGLFTTAGGVVDDVEDEIVARNIKIGEFQDITNAIITSFIEISTLNVAVFDELTENNDTYSAFTFRELGSLTNNVSLLHNQLDFVLKGMAGSNLANPLSIMPSIDNLEAMSNSVIPILAADIVAFDPSSFESEEQTLMIKLNQEILKLIDITNLGSDEINGTIQAFIDKTRELATIDIEIIERFEEDISAFINSVNSAVTKIFDIIDDENRQFKEIFNEITDSTRKNIEAFVSLTIVLLASAIAITMLPLLYIFRKGLSKMEKNFAEVQKGNLIVSDKKKYRGDEIGVMEEGFSIMVNNLADILGTLQVTAERLAGISEMLVAGAEEASASINNVFDTVSKISSGATEQNLLLGRVTNKLEEHLKHVRDASNQINEASYFVSKVAQRTNILGLNASIQAAKAGQYGKGFSVVAKEVRDLSNDTKRSANEITSLAENISFSIRNTVEEVIREVNVVTEVAENTATGSEEANASSSEQVIMLSEISETASELSTLATNLNEILQGFNVVLSKKQKKELEKSEKERIREIRKRKN